MASVRTACVGVLSSFIAACGYAGETGEAYKDSLAAKHVWSALQVAEWDLRSAPRRPFVYNADPDPDVDTIAFPVRDGSGYVAFTAKAGEGRVLSIPDDRAIAIDLKTLRDLLRKRMISDSVAAELVRRSS